MQVILALFLQIIYIYLGGHDSKIRSAEGYLDDFRIYDKALSETEVKQIYGYTLSRQQGRISPYAYFFNGSTTDATDNAYITKDTITDFPSTFSIAFWKRCLDKSVEGKSFVLSTASTNVIEIDVSNTVNFRIDNSSNILEDYNDVSWHHWVFTYSGTEMDIYKDGMNRVGHMINKKTGLTQFDVTVGNIIYVGGYQHGDASPSYLEDFRIYNKVLSGIQIQQIYSEWTGDIVDKKDNLKLWYQLNNNPVGIPDYPIFAGHESNLIAWYKFDGDDVADSSGNGNDLESVSLDGTLQTDFVYPSLKIPENNKYLFPLAITETLMTQNWSISFYVKIDSTNSANTYTLLFGIRTASTMPYDHIYFIAYSHSSGYPSVGYSVHNDRAAATDLEYKYFTEDGSIFLYDTWHYITLTMNKTDTDTTVNIYNNGTLIDSQTKTTNFTLYLDSTMQMALHDMTTDNTFGDNDDKIIYYADFRIYDKALSETEIKQIYGDRSKFDNGYVYNYANTSPYFDGVLKNVLKNTNSLDGYPGYKDHENDLIAWYKFDEPNSLKDETGNYPLTNNGSVSFSTDTKVIGSSSYFPNSDNNGFLNITGGINLYDIWNGNGISFSIWYKVNLNESDIAGRIFEFGNTNLHLIWMAVQQTGTGDNTISLYAKGGHTGGNGPNIFVGNGTLDNNWHHIVWIVDINSDWHCYVDGINQNITANWDIPNITGGYTTNRLGKSIYISDATQDLKGYLDDFRIYDKALSDFEVKQIYSGYTVSREKGHVSPYSYYWNGSTTDNNDNAYIEATGTATPMADITTANSMTISYYKKLEGTVSKNASLSPDFNILSGSTNRISVGVNAIVETFTYTVESAGTPGQTQYDITFAKDTVCDILIVGGGGGGGKPFSGGGGGGEVIYFQNKNIPSGSYTIKVGKGGSGSTVNNRGSNGEQSEAFLAISSGGGGGGGYSQYNHASGLNGGCGGGAGYNNTTNGIKQLTDNSGSDIYSNWGGTNNQYAGDGNDGGASGGFAGGGGGAGGSLSSLNPDGNDGIQINIDGNNHYWAGGGGGYSESSTDAYHSGDGGKGGGGGGSGVGGDSNDGKGGTGGINIGGPALDTSSGNGGDGGVHTGGGGGGTQLGYGGNGGSGIVIIRYSKQHIKLNDTSYETNVAFDLNVWYRWTFTYDGTNAKIYMMNIGNTALTPTPISQVGQELTPTFTGWNADETFDKVLIGGGSNSLPDASPAYLEDIRMYNTSFTEEDVKNLSLYNIPTTTTVSSGSGTVDLSDVGTGSYVLKLPEAPYGGYKDHINDLIVWYKFEKTPNGELRNYGKDSKYYGIVNNSGIAKPELVFSDSSTTVDTKFRLLELENNKLDKIHILDTNLKYDGTGDSNITYTVTPTSNINVDILVVGGGGGGGSAGAGGADVEYIQNYELTAGTEYTFKVGKGGDIGNIGGPSEMTSNLTNLYKTLGGGNGGSLTLGSTITEVFEYDDTHDTKGLHTWTKPTGLTEVTAYVWGAGGGGGYDKASNRKGQDGGNGGFIYCKINVTSINNLYIYAGQGGVVAYRDASSSLSVDIKSFGGGGSAKTGYSTSDTHGIGGGGGLSGIFEYDSSFSTDATNNTIGESAIPIVIAGGGGGGGTYMSGTTYHGGDAGSELLDMTTGDFIWPGSDAIANAGKQNYEGKGGGVSAVTTFAANTIKIAGGKYYGGSDVTVNNFSSGGGSGYFGGSTGYHDSSGTIASSGGGSSYVKNLQTSNATNIYNNTIGNQPGNYGYMPGRKGIRIDISVVGRSISSKLSEMTGGNGLIVLEYTPSISSPPIASATSGGGLVLTDPLEYHSPLLALGKGFTGGNYYYESNLDGTLINYAGGGGGSASSGTDATTLGGGKGGAGLYYSITTINTEYGKGGNSFEASSLNIEMQKADLTYEKLNIDLDNKTTFVIDDPNIYNDFNIGPFDYTHPEDSSKYTMFMFRYNDINNANNQTTYKLNLNIGIDVKIFVIGGGGAGGSAGTEADGDSTSGGGGGGMAYKKITINKSTYNIIVGRGGYGTDGSVSTGRDGEDGYSSSFLNLIAYGGKGGKIGGSSSSTDYITADGGLGGSSTGGDINGTGGNGGHNAAYPNLAKVSAGSGGNGTNNAPGGGGGAQGYTSNNGSGGNGGNGNSNYFTGGGGGGPADSTNTNEQGLGGIGFYSGGRGGIKGITEANKGTSGDGPGGGLAIPGISRSNNGGGGGSFGGGGGGHCDYGNSDDASGNNGGTGGYGGDGVVILLLPEIIPSSSSSTPSITSSLPATIIKPTTTNPTLVKNNINEVYYEFTAQETIQFIQTISATVFATNGTNMINETIIFEPHKLYEIDPDTAQITTTDDSATNIIISPLATGKTSTITGESLSYDNPTIIIKYSRLTTYEYGKGGDLNTTGNSGAIIIRYNYYDQTTNPQRVILQKPGYLNPYSYVWRGNATQPVDDSYISINDPAGILNNQFLSINFWLERDTTTTSKDYIFAITEHNPYNELLGIGLDSSNLFVNILGSSNTTPHYIY